MSRRSTRAGEGGGEVGGFDFFNFALRSGKKTEISTYLTTIGNEHEKIKKTEQRNKY